MNEFWVPTTEQFATWRESHRPVAVVRLVCHQGHDLAEWWLLPNGETHRGIGHHNRSAVHDEGVGGFAGPFNPQRPQDVYFQTVLECSEPDCKYRLTLEDGLEELDSTLTLLRGIEGLPWTHPSGAPMIVREMNELLEQAARRRR